MWQSLLSNMGGLMGSYGTSGGLTGAFGAPAGSDAEFDNFDKVGFDQLSNKGITGSVSGNTDGLSMGNILGMFAGSSKGGTKYQTPESQSLGMSALKQYKDMSTPQIDNLLSRVGQMQALSNNAMQRQPVQQSYINPYIAQLLGGL